MQTEEEYFVPLTDQRVFGAGIKRKRVNFVSASASSPITPTPSSIEAPSERYLSIVLKDSQNIQRGKDDKNLKMTCTIDASPSKESMRPTICSICHLLIPLSPEVAVTTRTHETSLAHQVCLTHSHPPSCLDRARPGLKYLSSYGWDPDSRVGLGSASDGILKPIKGKLKCDTVGLGMCLKGGKQFTPSKAEKLDAGRVRNEEERAKIKGDILRNMFYQSDDVQKYLRGVEVD